jgi:hypothetical protein
MVTEDLVYEAYIEKKAITLLLGPNKTRVARWQAKKPVFLEHLHARRVHFD